MLLLQLLLLLLTGSAALQRLLSGRQTSPMLQML
jgi:hypothetical protein